MFRSLLPYLGDPHFHLIALIVATVAALEALVATWAATSSRHWFWRALAVWGTVMALAPIRVYEPALVFAISSQLTVFTIHVACWLRRRRSVPLPDNQPPRRPLQFGLSDVLLGMLVLGLSLAGLMHVFRLISLRDWRDIAVPAAAITALSVLSWWAARGAHRRWGAATLVAAIPLSAWLLWSHVPWLSELDPLGIRASELFLGRGTYLAEWMLIAVTFAEFAALVAVGLALFLPASPRHDSARFRRRLAYGLAVLLAGPLGMLYVQMYWLTPFPPHLPSQPSDYVRLLQIADFVEDGAPSAQRSSLHAEVLTLVAKTQSLPFDLSSEPVLHMVERTSIDRIQAFRALSRSLQAESQAAAARGDFSRARDFALAEVRLGAMFCRNAHMLDALVGHSMIGSGLRELIRLRDQLEYESLEAISDELARLEQEREPAATIIWRDVAYSQRAYHWQARLQHLVKGFLEGPPPEWETNQSFLQTYDYWRSLQGLLRTDLAIRRFQAERGELPGTLDALVPTFLPALPRDPFSNQPFVYRPAADNFTLYSLGRNRTDDDGRFTNRLAYHQDDGYDLDLETLLRP